MFGIIVFPPQPLNHMTIVEQCATWNALTKCRTRLRGFNLYYGARSRCGRGVPGWRCLDLAALTMSLINPYVWPYPQLERMVYCTALRAREGDPSSLCDQQT